MTCDVVTVIRHTAIYSECRTHCFASHALAYLEFAMGQLSAFLQSHNKQGAISTTITGLLSTHVV